MDWLKMVLKKKLMATILENKEFCLYDLNNQLNEGEISRKTSSEKNEASRGRYSFRRKIKCQDEDTIGDGVEYVVKN